MDERLVLVIENLKLVRKMMPKYEFTISVYDADSRLCFYDDVSGAREQIKIGDTFHDPTGKLERVLSRGVAETNILPKEVFGVPVMGTLVPIFDKREVIGCVITTTNVDDPEEKKGVFARFEQITNTAKKSISEISNSYDEMFHMIKDMGNISKQVGGDLEQTVTVVGKIGKNASKSKILALNASIEAARSGDAGKGFSVVAKEMGDMSTNSSLLSSEINNVLTNITNHIHELEKTIKTLEEISNRQLENIMGISDTLGSALDTAKDIAEQSDKKTII